VGVSGELPRCWIYRQQAVRSAPAALPVQEARGKQPARGVGAAAEPAAPRPGVLGHPASTTGGSWRIRNQLPGWS
jgi:hypothetical protein